MKEKTIRIGELRETGLKPDRGFVESVEKYGVLHNIVVVEDGAGYSVIAGRRRVEAARKAGHDTIRAVVLDDLSVEDKALVTLMENMKRSSNPADEAKAIAVLQKKGTTQEEIAKVMGVERSQVAKRALLLKLVPALFVKLEDGSLRSSVARELAQMSKEEQGEWAKRDTVTLKEVQEARRIQTPEPTKEAEVDVDTVPHPTPNPAEDSNPSAKFSSTPESTSKSVLISQTTPEEVSEGLDFPEFDLTEKETGILKHAYESGLLKPGKGTLPPLDGVAEDYGMKKKTYSKNLVNVRRKILTKICVEMFDG